MKKHFSKAIIAVLMVLCMLFCFAACSGNDTNKETNNQSSKNIQTGSEITELVNVYNKAVSNGTVKCISSSKKVQNGKLWIGDNSDKTMDLLAPEQKELLAKFENSDTSGILLPNIKDGDVAEVTVNENVVIYKLKPTQKQNEIAQGYGGYINIIDTEETKKLVEGVKSFANVKGNVKVNSSDYSMSEGILTVTYNNKKHKKIESVSFSGKQKVKAEMKYLVISINAELDYTLSSEYKAQ